MTTNTSFHILFPIMCRKKHKPCFDFQFYKTSRILLNSDNIPKSCQICQINIMQCSFHPVRCTNLASMIACTTFPDLCIEILAVKCNSTSKQLNFVAMNNRDIWTDHPNIEACLFHKSRCCMMYCIIHYIQRVQMCYCSTWCGTCC